jgi:hypothetical protein
VNPLAPIHSAVSPFLAVISAMITPSILILASGSLVASTLTRLARVVDRARILIDRIPALRAAGGDDELAATMRWLRMYLRRAELAERALQLYYFAIGLFVAGSLAITIDDLTGHALPWLALVLVVCGAACLFFGTAALVVETNIATGTLRSEVEHACGPEFARRPLPGETAAAP